MVYLNVCVFSPNSLIFSIINSCLVLMWPQHEGKRKNILNHKWLYLTHDLTVSNCGILRHVRVWPLCNLCLFNPCTLREAKYTCRPDDFGNTFTLKSIFLKTLEGEILIRYQTTTFHQIFSELSIYFPVILKSMKVADDTFSNKSDCEWIIWAALSNQSWVSYCQWS